MEKNGNNHAAAASDSQGVCQKIFSAITVSPAFRTVRRATHFPQEPTAASAARSTYPPQPQPKKSAESAPVVVRIPITSEKIVGKCCDDQANSKVAAKIEPKKPPTHHGLVHKYKEELAKATHSKVEEDKHEAQAQARNIEGKKQGGLDINDKFSEYINRAKIKIRSMSSKKIAESDEVDYDGKKRETENDHFSDYIQRAKNKFRSMPSNLGGRKNASFKRE
ncbi:uncharacterized protein LOC103947545 [Pyrus x bretschneideri]|uniref:uncharacterized protein LOC103947545 n=1 Tax=Pyrus x bretschneideri TaxID=225117 RepID=UPI00202E9883|nr:uncharacterized protein LOC103947545 [Pyrus x bretschneideri]